MIFLIKNHSCYLDRGEGGYTLPSFILLKIKKIKYNINMEAKYKEKIKHALGIFLDDGEEYLFGGIMSNLNKKHPVLFSEILFDDLMSEDTTEEEKKAISWWVSRNTQQISLSMKLKFMETLYPLGGDFTSDAIEIADTMLPELDFLPILEKIRVFCVNKEDKANLIYAEAVIKQIKEGLESE